MRSTSFHIVNLGCKVNRVEADSMRSALIAKGSLPAEEEAADLVIVNTCTVTAEADRKARKAVRHVLAANPVAVVVVTGCAAAMNPMAFESLDPRVRVMGKTALERELAEGLEQPCLRVGEGFNTRVGLKVQDGCDHACTYCVVHVARGKARSVAVDEVCREARAHLDAGVKEIVLTGIDIGAYRDGKMRLPQLASKLLEESRTACNPGEQAARIRISSIEPMNVGDEVIDLLAESGGLLCRHLHLPLQSGSTKVLREMGRPYSAEGFSRLVAKLHARVPGIALSTDIIVGFPGETEEDFKQTCELARESRFMRLHVFPYSRREGTPAAKRADQVPFEIKRERAAQLRSIGVALAADDLASRAGSTELCLVQGATGLTESYHEVNAPEGAKPGELVTVTL